jgi:hypothetical protein
MGSLPSSSGVPVKSLTQSMCRRIRKETPRFHWSGLSSSMRTLEESPPAPLFTKVHHKTLGIRCGAAVQTHSPKEEVSSMVVKPSSKRYTAHFLPTS